MTHVTEFYDIKESSLEIEEISAEYIQCQACGYIGKTENMQMPPEFGSLLSCPACSSMSVEGYTGPKSVSIPVELLSDVNAKLIAASIYLKGDWPGEMKEAQREHIVAIWKQLNKFMREQGLLIGREENQ